MMNRRDQSRRYIGHFSTISAQWELTPLEQMSILGLDNLDELNYYLSGKKILSVELLEKIDYLIRIYSGLHTLFSGARAANTWVRRPNSSKIFRGRTALSCLMDGRVSLKTVSDYVNSQLV